MQTWVGVKLKRLKAYVKVGGRFQQTEATFLAPKAWRMQDNDTAMVSKEYLIMA